MNQAFDKPSEPRAKVATPDEVLRQRLEIFNDLPAGRSAELLKRYHPDYLLQPADAKPPTRGGPWSMVASRGKWTLWKRSPDRSDEGRRNPFDLARRRSESLGRRSVYYSQVAEAKAGPL